MDEAFDRLYAAYFGIVPLPWGEFTAAALQYFDNNVGTATAHDAYFNNFTVIWRSIVDAGRLSQAERVWVQALHPAQQWEQAHQGQRIHKGTPYYFWAVTALLRGDVDHGYLLVHQGVDEDVRTLGRPALILRDTPSSASTTTRSIKRSGRGSSDKLPSSAISSRTTAPCIHGHLRSRM